MKFIELRFRAVESVDVPVPFAPPSGQRRVIGKAFSPEKGGMELSDDYGLLRLSSADFHAAKVQLRKCVDAGELVCADVATAQRLGLPGARIASAPLPSPAADKESV